MMCFANVSSGLTNAPVDIFRHTQCTNSALVSSYFTQDFRVYGFTVDTLTMESVLRAHRNLFTG